MSWQRRRRILFLRPTFPLMMGICRSSTTSLRNTPVLEWSAHQLRATAAMLARTMADLTREQQLLRQEGGVAFSEKGTPVANPRKSIVQMHASSILSFRRSLSLHARASGEARDVAKRRGMAKDIESDNPLEDDLLAQPG